MRRNRNLLVEQLNEKFVGQATKSLITEAFINALPFDRNAIAKESAKFAEFSNIVLNSMSPETMLSRAIESTSDGNYQSALKEIETQVKDITSNAADEIANETTLSDETTPEIVNAAKLDADSVRKLSNVSKDAGISAISKIIKENVIAAIKQDKDAYEEEQSIREEIKEVLKKEDNTTDDSGNIADEQPIESNGKAIEAYLDYLLAPTDVRHPISLLSKLQDMAMEGLLYLPDSSEEFDPILSAKIVMESTFDYFNSDSITPIQKLSQMAIASEGEHEYNQMNEDEKRCKMKKIAKTAFICSICILTLLQTLKTMHFIHPKAEDVRKIIDNKTQYKSIDNDQFDKIAPIISHGVDITNKSIALGSLTLAEAVEQQNKLENIQNTLSRIIATENMKDSYNNLMSKVSNAMESLDQYIVNKDIDTSNTEMPITSELAARAKSNNIATLEYNVNQMSKHPTVFSVRIPINSSEEINESGTAIITLQGMTNNDIVIRENSINLEILPEFGNTLAEVIRNIANYCSFENKGVYIYYTDSGYTVPIKG